ncbi:putative phosphoglycerate mutase [Dehalogenimonas formicexedens]|uniref:Putative phosphoglycerate mutase n=1 Tax=Dehalogenimonas formicexedens TaxID=1839801 RepID=A0A1P8FAE8_9CHLR|nr:histidine phosphatase family protein [Dehalogenimonas formicexedens]APV45420.1 putative phosphoglycerate mutase [Dehalogenimonas formicexedens]
MTRIFIARHAETEWNRIRRIQGGGSDTPLNETGLKQVKCLAGRLANEKLAMIISSPLGRARVTAEAIAGEHGSMPVELEPDLREIDAGELEGKAVAEVGGGLGLLLTAVSENGLPSLPGGESLADVRERAWRVVLNLASRFPEGEVLIVTHYFVVLSIICRVLGLRETDIRKFRLNTGSLSIIEVDPAGTAKLVVFNESCFQVDSHPW